MLPSTSAKSEDLLRLLSREFAMGSGENLFDLLARDASINAVDGNLPGAMSGGANGIARLWSMVTAEQRGELLARLPSLQGPLAPYAALAAVGGASNAADVIPRWLSGDLLQAAVAHQAVTAAANQHQQQQQQQQQTTTTMPQPQLQVPPLNMGGNALSASSVAAVLAHRASMGSGDMHEQIAAASLAPISMPSFNLSALPNLGQLGAFSGAALAAAAAAAAGAQQQQQQQQRSAEVAAAASARPAVPAQLVAAKVEPTEGAATNGATQAAGSAGAAAGGGAGGDPLYQTRAATGKLPTVPGSSAGAWSSGRDEDDMADGDDETPFASFVPTDERGGGGANGGGGGQGSDGGDDDDDYGGNGGDDGCGGGVRKNRGGRKKAPEIDWRSVTDPDERRRLRRMAKNRRTAAASRERKRAVVDNLHAQVETLQGENSSLRSNNRKLVAQLAAANAETQSLRQLLAQVSMTNQNFNLVQSIQQQQQQQQAVPVAQVQSQQQQQQQRAMQQLLQQHQAVK